MTARVRNQSMVPPSPSRGARSSGLPPYQPPQFGLTPDAQRQLAALAKRKEFKILNESLVEAQAGLANAAADINDRVSDVQKDSRTRRNREGEDSTAEEDAEDAEQSLADLQSKVERMTGRMEESMRKLIDGQHGVQHMKESLESTTEHARVNASTQASTQARTQRRRTMQDGKDGEDEEYQDFEPTDPAAGTQVSASEKFKKDMETAKTKYQSYTMAERYADNPKYSDFKRLVHDAQHHDDGEVLPNARDWFPAEAERPAPGVTTRRQRADDEADDSDDDIAVSRATVSTKCPLTLQEFKSPLTSNKCPHSFEKEAILQMVSQARPVPTEAGRVEKAVQCPVSGCSKMLTKDGLREDNVLIRKIRRLQEAARLAEEAAEEEEERGGDGTQGRTTFIDDDEEDEEDVDAINSSVFKGTQIKGERGQSAAPRPSQRTAGGVVDLADDSSEEEAEEGEDEDTVMG